VRPALWVFTSNTLECNIWTVLNHLLELGDDVLVLRKVQSLDLRVLALDVVESPVLVDHDDTASTVHERKVGAHLANWASTPNSNNIALLDTSVNDTVPASGDDVGKEKTLLVWNVVGKLEEVDVSAWDTNVLGLTTSETTGEMAVTEHTGGVAAIHSVLDLVGVGLLTLGGKLLLAVHALEIVSDLYYPDMWQMLRTSPQAIWKDATTRSPFWTFLTPGPNESTIPQNSWPRMSPFSISTTEP